MGRSGDRDMNEGSLAVPRPRRSDAGTNIPAARKIACEAGTMWGKLTFSGVQFPRHCRMFMARPSGGLWHF
jgi:hypothetical protein